FETDLVETAGTGLLTLVATAASLAKAGTDAATNAATFLLGAFTRLDSIQTHGLTLNLDEILNLLNHAANCRRIFEFRSTVQLAQTQAAHGGTVVLLGADDALDELHCDFLVSHDLPQNLVNRETTLGGDLGRRIHLRQTVDGGAHDVVGIGRAVGLGDDVGHANHFEDSAHGAAGDDAGTFRSRLDHHGGCAVTAKDRVMHGAVLQADLGHLATGLFHSLLRGDRHFAGLALAHADAAIAITNNGECGKTENPAALNHLGDAVDRDHLLAHAVIALFSVLRLLVSFRFSHFLTLSFRGDQNFRPASRAASANA